MASIGKPLPRPLNLNFWSISDEIVSAFEELKTMVLLTPVSNIKFSFFLLISIGITIILLIN